MIPVEERLAVQAVVEGIGVPVAIGATGVLLLALNLLGLGTGAVIVFGLVLAVVWTAVAVGVYRSYTGALGEECGVARSRPAASTSPGTTPRSGPCSGPTTYATCASASICSPAPSPASATELRQLAEHADTEVRVRALASLAAGGDARAATELRTELVALLDDQSPKVRAAALDAVQPDDAADDDGPSRGQSRRRPAHGGQRHRRA